MIRKDDTDTTLWGPSEFLKNAYFSLVQAYDQLCADEDAPNARRALALLRQVERLEGKVIRRENKEFEAMESVLDEAALVAANA